MQYLKGAYRIYMDLLGISADVQLERPAHMSFV